MAETPAAPRPDFETYFHQQLAPDLQDLERERLALVRQLTTQGLVAVAILALAVWLAATQVLHPIVAVAAAAGVAVVVGWRFSSRMKEYRAGFKGRVIRKLVSYVEPSLSYTPDNFLGEEMFEESGLFDRKPDAYDGNDLVEGMLGATKIAFSDVHAQYKTTTTDGKGNTQTHWHTLFKGVLFVADFNKAFRSRTYVLPDTAERLLGSFGQKLQALNPGRNQLIKLENPDFERVFVVYGDDQIEARYILSPSLMEHILSYQQQTGADLRVGFVDGCMFVAIPTNADQFEPSVFSSVVDRSRLKDYINRLQLTTGIVGEFKLNTRIWGKT